MILGCLLLLYILLYRKPEVVTKHNKENKRKLMSMICIFDHHLILLSNCGMGVKSYSKFI